MNKTGFRLSFLLVLLCAQPAFAQMEVYRARLSPMPTTPATVDEITGEGEVILTLSGSTLTVQGEFSGMNSAATTAHLRHGPPAQPGPVVHALEIDDAAAGEISGVIDLTEEQVEALRNNALYVQVNSTGNSAGELRGWIFLRRHFDNL